MNNVERSIKIYGLIIGIILFIALMAGLSYAYYTGRVEDTTTVQGEVGACFDVDYVKGGNVSGADLLLLDESTIINNNEVTVTDGMVLTSLSAGINSRCQTTHAYMDVYLKNITLNNAFINGNSAGALKYVIATYNSTTYPNATLNSLKGNSFDIVGRGVVNSTSERLIFTDPMLPNGSMNNYLVIFYLDGDLTFNDAANTSFSATISATANLTLDNHGATMISNLFHSNSTVSNNSITYNIDTANNLIKDTDNNIRYYGANPNNYIYFNCETYPSTNCEKWRIIGVVDGKLKIMRGSAIGGYSWDTSANTTQGNSGYGINEWSQADLMKLLNPGYTSETVGGSLYYNKASGTCYNGRSNATTSCNFTSTGLKNDATKNKIADATWRTAGFNTNSIRANQALNYEKGSLVGSSTNDGVTRTTSWPGKIAVPNVSDYGYAADFNKCTVTMVYYHTSECETNNWMTKAFNGYITWLLAPNSGYSFYVWVANSDGYLNNGDAYYASRVVPTLYLSPEQVIESGTGSEADPYGLSA